MTARFLAALLGACTLAGAPTLKAADAPRVFGERAWAPASSATPRLRLSAKAGVSMPQARVELTAPDAADIALLRRQNASGGKALAIGFGRDIAPVTRVSGSQLAWTQLASGAAVQVAITSSQAAALRVALELSGVPGDVEMTFFGSGDPSRLFGPVRVGEIRDRTHAWWSPVTEGATQTVEFFAPAGSEAAAKAFVVTAVSHLVAGPSSHFAKSVADVGKSGACNVDVACPPLNGNRAFNDAASAVAQMVFTRDCSFCQGATTFACTGVLLNDSDPSTQVPYLLSANGCFDNDQAPFRTPQGMQAIADTLTTIWHFDAASCGSKTPASNWSQLMRGAQFLYGNPTDQALLLRLNDAPPDGAFYLGWDATTMPAGTSVTVIHHPVGDLKKVALGSLLRLSARSGGDAATPLYEVSYGSGTTEAGSGGGPLLTFDGSEYLARGALWGGLASCSSSTASDWYARFDQIYPAIAAYLGENGSAVDYTDLWWGGDGQSGWGLNLMQHSSTQVFGVWYTYDAKRRMTWYVIPGGRWTSSNVFTFDIYRTNGPAANATTFNPDAVGRTRVGQGTLVFADPNNGSFAFTIDGVSGTKPIRRQSF